MVLGWLTRLCVVIALVGLVGYDTVTLVAAHLGAKTDANNAASAASSSWNNRNGEPTSTAYQTALTAAEGTLPGSEKIVPNSMVIATNGTVTLQIHRTTSTIVAHDFSFLKSDTTFNTTGSAGAPQ